MSGFFYLKNENLVLRTSLEKIGGAVALHIGIMESWNNGFRGMGFYFMGMAQTLILSSVLIH